MSYYAKVCEMTMEFKGYSVYWELLERKGVLLQFSMIV